ncbi:histidinol-phosphatase [Lentinus tigrinus ALCF2SS1-7]|uniref:Histidinol-phosphatase n=1 Tax=Lentinus tigrinus ALCF2SS1-6 TaxID=1328759 RepID=A0A5C2SCR6_9APHY|nr:histidinol-phosphatase [Lentinus tigrinus ALCF2SS1-6]RPD75028.1 histidinol-phosphatase [Lentinus tigrinus ALCF2SS1-7]
MPVSHHSHSGQFCKHAAGTLEEVVLEAIRQGFRTYGLTEHVPRHRLDDLYPEEEGMSLDSLKSQFDAFLTEAHRLKEKYADQITLLVGLETEYITETDLTALESLLSEHGKRIEYIVGSVHHVAGIPIDFDRPTFDKALASFSSTTNPDPMAAFLNAYFDAQYTLMQRVQPEVIGHLDLCRLYNPTLRFCDYPDALARIRRNVRYAVEYGALFELNAAAFRKGWDAAYPAEDVVEIIRENAGRFTLSDDSHGPHAVGLNYSRLVEYARRVGIDELWVLAPSSVTDGSNLGRRGLAAHRVPGQWWEDPFWQGKAQT